MQVEQSPAFDTFPGPAEIAPQSGSIYIRSNLMATPILVTLASQKRLPVKVEQKVFPRG